MILEFLLHRLSKKIKFLLLLILFISSSVAVQAQECGTEELSDQEMEQLPWYGNPDYLYNFLDSIQPSNSTARIEPDIRFKVPIRFWILRGETNDPGNVLDDGEDDDLPEERELQRLIDDANNAFRNTEVPSKIQFYMREAERVVNEETAPSAREIVRFTQNGFGTRFPLC